MAVLIKTLIRNATGIIKSETFRIIDKCMKSFFLKTEQKNNVDIFLQALMLNSIFLKAQTVNVIERTVSFSTDIYFSIHPSKRDVYNKGLYK